MPRCFLALGGNLGAVEATFQSALERLDRTRGVRVLRASAVHRSAAVGREAGAPFRNAAAEIETDLAPLDLLDLLQAVETEHGRARTVRWGPRTLDLDVLLYGDAVIEEPRLRVPHPACWYRRFVLDPLAEIAADVVHPEKGITVAALRERLLPRPFRVALAGGDAAQRTQIAAALSGQFAEIRVEDWSGAAAEPALLAWLGVGTGPPFEQLPLVPRLDVSAADDPEDALRYAVQAALGG